MTKPELKKRSQYLKDRIVNIWTVLAAEGCRKREAYKKLGYIITDDIQMCPACTLDNEMIEEGYRPCDNCPLHRKWRGPEHSDRILCGSDGTYYSLWSRAKVRKDTEGMKYWAKKVRQNLIDEWKV